MDFPGFESKTPIVLLLKSRCGAVEYALSRTASPALIAEYQTQLPDRTLLQAKLHEFYLQNQADVDVS